MRNSKRHITVLHTVHAVKSMCNLNMDMGKNVAEGVNLD